MKNKQDQDILKKNGSIERNAVRNSYSDLFYRDLNHWVFVNRLGADDKLRYKRRLAYKRDLDSPFF